jgi:hypothetical protein
VITHLRISSTALVILFAGVAGVSSEEESLPKALDPLVGCYLVEEPEQTAIREIGSATNDEDLARFAVYIAYAWKKKELSVTFAPGTSPALMEGVLKIASKWNDVCGIKFVKGGAFETGDIRVAFMKGGGNHSKIGRTATNLPSGQPTMNLETCATWPVSSREFGRVVLHEFGHALGFAHEHQHPHERCTDEIIWPVAYKFYADDQHWTKDQVDGNLRTITDSTGMALSDSADHASVMRYYLDPRILRDGKKNKCYAPPTYTISTGDMAGALRLYPVEVSGFGMSPFQKVYGLLGKSKLSDTSERLLSSWKRYWGE